MKIIIMKIISVRDRIKNLTKKVKKDIHERKITRHKTLQTKQNQRQFR